jgi:RNA polymerase sigma-54 factor
MVQEHWDAVVQRRYSQLARRTRSTVAQVKAAMHYLQTEITPCPASQYRDPWDYKPDASSEAVRPDVIIKRSALGFEVEIIGAELPTLNINARYRTLYELIKQESPDRPNSTTMVDAEMRKRLLASISLHERRHIVQYVERANLFLRNIQQRRRTMLRITQCLIETQQGFIETGSRAFLIPLTRTELAQRAGVHESTVSRALLRKFVQLPNQDVLSFDEFFTPAGSIKDTIVQLIASEDPTNPYSDERIRQMLEEGGRGIARRTVVKYREAMRIPASYMRRRHE